MTELYHQLGHNHNWNLNSLTMEGTGSGVIIAPRYMAKEDVYSLPLELRQQSLFDPQFYVPNSSRGALATYEFFPQVVASGFQTTEWTPEQALESASGCLEFQIINQFRYLVIPTRFRDGMPSDFVESQTTAFIDPFLTAYNNFGRPIPCLLQLILTDQMLMDDSYSRDLLNWVTGLEEVEGVYLIYKHNRTYKQIHDIDFLVSVDRFVSSLKQAGMIVVMGYLNTESIPFLCADPDIMTIGSYENTRNFNTLSMEEKDPGRKMRGPNARVYISRLLQWVEHHYLGAIAKAVGNLDNYIDDNAHRLSMFQPTYQWNFQKPQPYQHYFVSFADQFNRLNSYVGADRVQGIRAELQRAIDEYERLEAGGVALDPNSGGRHLYSWLTFLNQR